MDNYYCKNCNKENKAIINNRINKSPLYLIVSLNRFIEEEQKLIVNPNIPEILYKEVLNIGDILDNYNENYLYDLYGVIISKELRNTSKFSKMFNSLTYKLGKEYPNIAYCKNNGDWISYEDEKIENLENPYDKGAYILFYKARNQK